MDGHTTVIEAVRGPRLTAAAPSWSDTTYDQVIRAALATRSDGQAFLIARQSARVNADAATQATREPLRGLLPLTRVLTARTPARAAPIDIGWRIRLHCAAAVEARMSGAPVHVMSSAGSGNAGITAVVPIVLLAESIHADEDTVARSVLLSHATTSYVKARLGRVSPLCGCAVAAGAGAAAGMAHLFGCGATRIPVAAQCMLANLGGMFCDGAKETCALKVGTAAQEAYIAACYAADRDADLLPQGILGRDLDETVAGLAVLAEKAMSSFDSVLISLVQARADESRESASPGGDRCFA
ncbi:MAG: L-serine ammonia-lyase, iron-sulfur-dependent, subunit alpha [Candidatus Bipolaricaulia bacterium]